MSKESKIDIPSSFIDSFENLKNPKDYFVGLPPLPMPELSQLLIFSRKNEALTRGAPSLHHRFVMIHCLERSGTVIVDGESFRLIPGSVLLVLPHQLHHYQFDQPATAMKWLFITFESRVSSFWEPLTHKVLPLTIPVLETLNHLVETYVHQPSAQQPIQLLMHIYLYSLGLDAIGQGNELTPTLAPATIIKEDSLLAKLLDAQKKEKLNGLNIKQVAQLLGVSRSTLTDQFKKKLGLPIATYFRESKIKQATSYLLGSDKNVSEIAELCGFSGLYAFSRTFKAVTGFSPRQYQKKHRALVAE